MRASQFVAYINANSDDIKIHNHSRVTETGERTSWQTVSVNGKELTGLTLTDKLKAARKRYRNNVSQK